jgi:hypothetical protein
LPVLVLSQELATFLADNVAGGTPSSVARRARQQLEHEVLPEREVGDGHRAGNVTPHAVKTQLQEVKRRAPWRAALLTHACY